MKVCVFGVGAIGGHLAARLGEGGADVSLLARGANLAALRTAGLTVHTPGKDLHLRAAVSDDAAELGVQDVVLVTVKAPALPGVARAIGPLLGRDTAVVFAMNGIPWWYYANYGGANAGTRFPRIDPGDGMWNAVGPERTIGAVVYSSCTVLAPGVVKVGVTPGRFILGELDGSISPRVTEIARVVRAGGLATEPTPAIRDVVWQKLLDNLSSGPLSVLVQSTLQQMAGEPTCAGIIRTVIAEATAVAQALGHDVGIDPDAKIARGLTSSHKTSILQDLEAGRVMEIDAQFVAPLDMARRVNVPTPTLDLLIALAKQRARAAGLYDG